MRNHTHTVVFEQLLDPVSRSLNREAAEKLVRIRVDTKTQARIDKLARKCNEGKLTAAEKDEYESWVWAIDLVTILQLRAQQQLSTSLG
jgi:hypothetical protein